MNESVSIQHFAELQARIHAEQIPHRHENEVRLVAGLPTNARRSWYIEGTGGVRERRGDEVADRLRSDVWALMKRGGKEVAPVAQEELPL